jgi:hypothetical protein
MARTTGGTSHSQSWRSAYGSLEAGTFASESDTAWTAPTVTVGLRRHAARSATAPHPTAPPLPRAHACPRSLAWAGWREAAGEAKARPGHPTCARWECSRWECARTKPARSPSARRPSSACAPRCARLRPQEGGPRCRTSPTNGLRARRGAGGHGSGSSGAPKAYCPSHRGRRSWPWESKGRGPAGLEVLESIPAILIAFEMRWKLTSLQRRREARLAPKEGGVDSLPSTDRSHGRPSSGCAGAVHAARPAARALACYPRARGSRRPLDSGAHVPRAPRRALVRDRRRCGRRCNIGVADHDYFSAALIELAGVRPRERRAALSEPMCAPGPCGRPGDVAAPCR